jgi:hypothetical protein
MRKARYLFPIISILILAIIAGCKTHPPQSTTNQVATLTFGQGGGVTGKYTEFSLTVDGNLYKHTLPSGEKTFLKKLSKKECRPFFIDAEGLGLLKMDFNYAFNINYYIIYRKGVEEKKINWGDARKPPPEGVKELWDKLWEVANKSVNK